jgi:biopolymer transport protein ExbD
LSCQLDTLFVVLEVIMRMQPMVQAPTPSQALSTNAYVDLQRKISAATEERRAKKMAAKVARQKGRAEFMAEQGVKLESLERLLQGLQSSETDPAVLVGAHEKLRKLQAFVQDMKTSKMRQVPRIGLIYGFYRGNKLLTRVPADTWRVHLVLLCEEPGHEHIVKLHAVSGYNLEDIDKDQIEKLQPILASGLQVVQTALSKATHITNLHSVSLSILGERPWDLGAIDLEEHAIHTKMASADGELGRDNECRLCGQVGDVLCCTTCDTLFCSPCLKQIVGDEEYHRMANSADWRCHFCHKQPFYPLRLQHDQAVKESLKAQQESLKDDNNIELFQKGDEGTAAESLQSYLEDNEISIFDTFGLLRIRYTATDQSDRPRYRQGTIAWLCPMHQNYGLEAGILESYPLRIYHDLEYDQHRGFL